MEKTINSNHENVWNLDTLVNANLYSVIVAVVVVGGDDGGYHHRINMQWQMDNDTLIAN